MASKLTFYLRANISEESSPINSFVNNLENRLYDSGFNQIELSSTSGLPKVQDVITAADIFIYILDDESVADPSFLAELATVKSYAESDSKKLAITILTGLTNNYAMSKPYLAKNNVNLSIHNELSVKEAIDATVFIIQSFMGRQLAYSKNEKANSEKIESSTDDFVNDTKKELEGREFWLKVTAYVCFALGLIAIIIGIWLVFKFADEGLSVFVKNLKDDKGAITVQTLDWSLVVYNAVKSILIITLLIAASKYCFNLAKSFMVEALKLSDRVHAINFGRFYLRVFSKKGIESKEFIDVFRDWNINNQNSAFSAQNFNDYDPKILEKMTDALSKITDAVKKEK